MNELIKYLIVIALSAIKFAIAVPLGYAFTFSITEMIILPIVGGILGVLIFSNFSKWLINLWNRFFPKKKHITITHSSRMVVKIWRRYGLIGIALISPCLISIPVGTFIAIRYHEPKKKILAYMSISIVFWTIVFTVLVRFFGVTFFEMKL